MILTRTPLRISLFGGGSDLPGYYDHFTGTTLSFTIDKYMYIALCRTAVEGVKVVYNEIEQVSDVNDIVHSRVRETLKALDVRSHIEISSFCEIPTKGTGLGSSSTFTVGLVNALCELTDKKYNRYDMAEMACHIEMFRCSEPIGKQDQYAAAFGGLNIFNFYRDHVEVHKPAISQVTLQKLNNNLMMFYTGITRKTSDILTTQSKNINFKQTHNMIAIAKNAENALRDGQLDWIGSMLNESWQLKKSLTDGITNDFIDSHYSKALIAGALGGKILGAGGGGYFLFYVPEDRQDAVRHALSDLKEFKFNFEDTGTTVVYNESKRTF